MVVTEPNRPDPDERFDELLSQYGSYLRSVVRRVCSSALGISADEVEQDARIRLWHALKRERNITDPASYLYRIAATAAVDAMRRVRARREDPLADGSEHEVTSPAEGAASPAAGQRSPEELAADRQIAHQISAALAQLPDQRRRAVGLHLRGFNSTEVGGILGWTEPKARNLIYRGLGDLRELLRNQGLELS
jgi:RNA polymerase sigma factor (sigma-70 family)